MERKINELLSMAGDMQSMLIGLKSKGIEINSLLVSKNRVSISLAKGIGKAAGAVGAEISTSPSGQHLNFDYKNAYFGQRK